MSELSLNFKVMRYMLQKYFHLFYQKNKLMFLPNVVPTINTSNYIHDTKKDSQFLLLVRMYCGLHEAHVYEREVDTETEEI